MTSIDLTIDQRTIVIAALREYHRSVENSADLERLRCNRLGDETSPELESLETECAELDELRCYLQTLPTA